MNDAQHPFFRPRWRRIAIVAFCAAWSILEFVSGSALWGTIAAGMTVYGAWLFLIRYTPPAEPTATPPPPSEKE